MFVWPGDLRVTGDVASEKLLVGSAGFKAPAGKSADKRSFSILVEGDLEVTGVLSVSQYHDVYVRGDVRASSILGHTGNLIATGKITADEVIAFECNEEGGFLHGASCTAALLCRFGEGGWDWAVSNKKGKPEVWEIAGDAKFTALERALEQLEVDASWSGVKELVDDGRAALISDREPDKDGDKRRAASRLA